MSDLTTTITEAAYANGVPPQLALAQASQESSLNPSTVNPKSGAQGLFQLEPPTAAQYGVTNPLDPVQNSQAGTAYLSDLYAEFGDWATALAAFDWGPGNVQKAQAAHGSDWLSYAPAETQDYVANILTNSGFPDAASAAADTGADGGAGTGSAPLDFFGLPSTSSATDSSWAWWALGIGGLAVAWAYAR